MWKKAPLFEFSFCVLYCQHSYRGFYQNQETVLSALLFTKLSPYSKSTSIPSMSFFPLFRTSMHHIIVSGSHISLSSVICICLRVCLVFPSDRQFWSVCSLDILRNVPSSNSNLCATLLHALGLWIRRKRTHVTDEPFSLPSSFLSAAAPQSAVIRKLWLVRFMLITW